MEKYYLKVAFMPSEQEVTKEEFLLAEQAAGFHSKFGVHCLATGGFSSGGVTGRIANVDEEN